MSRLPPNSLFSLANAPAAVQKPRGLDLAATLLTNRTPAASIGAMGLGLVAPPQTTMLSSLASLGLGGEAPKWVYVTKRFKTFVDNLALTALQDADGWTKIHGVVSCLNAAYYGHNSQTANAFLIGVMGQRHPR